jgi:HD-GYP domain-containing protein (c-di-GMP phosphodiesterase class II)
VESLVRLPAWSRRSRRDGRPPDALDPGGELLVEASRARVSASLDRRERLATLAVAGAFLVTAVPMAVHSLLETAPDAVTLLLLVAAYTLVSRVAFEVGTGVVVPTELVLVPMLFLLPPGLVPLLVAAGLVLSTLVDHLTEGAHPGRSLVSLCGSWHAVGPAIVFLVADVRGPAWSDWPVYLLALAAQLGFDFVSSAARERLALGISIREALGFMGLVYLVDAALAPVGLLAALSVPHLQYGFLAVLPLAGLLAFFARERRTRIDHALELSHAYRGTAFLLGDVVEADDAYTGSHSRDVVSLCLAVADDLGLDPRERRYVEFAALLHDVGKIRIPGEIINKPGPLTGAERAVIETHTLEGERLLERVGGLLGEVGRIVRSCHERWDGHGYPDRLAGEEIPRVARIVACCDAFNAMTTTRSYRAALPLETALAELEANSGTQFDPAVVKALRRVASELAPATGASSGALETVRLAE